MKRFLLITSILISSISVIGQTGLIKGTITEDGSNELLVGVSVIVKGTLLGTTTDSDGNFELSNLEKGQYVVSVSYIGYSTVEKTVILAENEEVVVNFQLNQDLIGLDEVVVTGIVNPRSALESSVAMTTMKPNSVKSLSATTTAEIFKAIPGVHSEASGGEGNANISVRGVPISTGGAKFLQLHEDGLPVLQFGDIMFGNADIFIRSDNNVGRIEAIRGGSASTFASNSPAGIINFISKTGTEEGGSIGTTFGLDYNDFRTDFDYGGKISNDITFHIGGFYRQGTGPREIDYDGNIGGQIKANLTKNFENGYARVYFKYLNDRAISYMPMPVKATGTGLNPNFESIDGFDLRAATLQSTKFSRMTGIDENGNPRTTDISDGMHPISNSIGTEMQFDIGDGWQLKEKGRFASTQGSFRTLFPMGAIGTMDEIAQGILGGNYSSDYKFSYANGANAGTALTSSTLTTNNGNDLLMQVASFDVDINSLNNFTNDIYLSKKFDNINFTLGYYKAFQQIAMFWDWQGYVTDVSGMPKLVNLESGDYFTEGGVTNYGVWGLGRKYDMKYNIDAPYANVDIEINKQLNIDASVRYDFGHANGYYIGGKSASIDVNGDGVLNSAESTAITVDNSNPNLVNYNYGYLSFSAGANYKFNDDNAVYGRISRGGRANADRLLYSPFLNDKGETIEGTEADMILQVEGGYKYKSPTLAFTFTPYFTKVSEQNTDPTEAEGNQVYLIDFQTYGAELEASAKLGDLTLNAGGVFTKAKITSSLDESNVGNTPRRVPALMYNVTPSYSIGKAVAGLNLIGTTKVFVSNSNEIVLPGYVYVNGFISYQIAKNLDVNLNCNNMANVLGFTEAESHSFTQGVTNYMRVRPITGRATSLSISYKF